ncbi:MAG: AMP-binding protein [Acidobacteriota bacterium]
MFPFAVKPSAEVCTGDGRGPDTVNRLLLHGARYHDRPAVFLCWKQALEGGCWRETPDWEADRRAVRVGLALSQRLGVAAGETVALWLPLGREWALIERGVWSIRAVSVPIWPEWKLVQVMEVLRDTRPAVLFASDPKTLRALSAMGGMPSSLRLAVLLEGAANEDSQVASYAEFMSYGGVLDTPELASRLRRTACEVRPETALSLEYSVGSGSLESGTLDHRTLARAMETILRRFPPRARRVQLVCTDQPDRLSRALVYAGWADGLTQTAFGAPTVAREQAAGLVPDLLVCRSEAWSDVIQALPGPRAPRASKWGIIARLWNIRGSQPPRADEGRRSWVVVTDIPTTCSLSTEGAEGEATRFVPDPDIVIPRASPSMSPAPGMGDSSASGVSPSGDD